MTKALALQILQIEHIDEASKDNCLFKWLRMDKVLLANTMFLVSSKVAYID